MVIYNEHKISHDSVGHFDDKTKKFSLSPSEMIIAQKEAIYKYQNGLDRSGIKELDPVTEKMFTRAFDTLEEINIATRNEYEAERTNIDRDIEAMQVGEEKTWDNSYKTFEGQEITDTIGIEKGKNGNNNYFYLDESNPRVGPQKVYITENEFNARLSDSVRNRVKAEQGIGKELYTLTADDGNKFIITDARDDDEKSNSFNDGFKEINMYHVAPDGSITQMKKEDVQALIEANGVTAKDIDKGKTSVLTLENIIKAFEKSKETRRDVKRFFEENMGNSTTTRA